MGVLVLRVQVIAYVHSGGCDRQCSLATEVTFFTVSKPHAVEGWVYRGCGGKAVRF